MKANSSGLAFFVGKNFKGLVLFLKMARIHVVQTVRRE